MVKARRCGRRELVPLLNEPEETSDSPAAAGSSMPSTSTSWESEAERVARGGPRGPGSGGKGRTRREQEQRGNRTVPAGHERKIAAKIRQSQAKKRRREQTGPHSTPLKRVKSGAATKRPPKGVVAPGAGKKKGKGKGSASGTSAGPAPLMNFRF